MLILIKKETCEIIGMSESWIDKIYDIPNETAESVNKRWLSEINAELKKYDIECSFHYPSIMSDKSKNKSGRLHRKILNEFEISNWIEKTYKVKSIHFNIIKILL